MVAMPLVLSQRTRGVLYESETSIVERASIVLWLLLAVAIPIVLRSFRVAVVAAVGGCIAFAAREGELHRVVNGESALRFSFYLDPLIPLPMRIAAASVVALACVCVVIAAAAIVRRAIADGGLATRWVLLATLLAMLAALTKVIDRAPALLSERGIGLPPTPRAIATSLEEHLELLLPILAFLVLLSFVRHRRVARLQRDAKANEQFSPPLR